MSELPCRAVPEIIIATDSAAVLEEIRSVVEEEGTTVTTPAGPLPAVFLVGKAGFEPAASASRTLRANQAALLPGPGESS